MIALCFVLTVYSQSITVHNKHETENVDEKNIVLVDQPDDVPDAQGMKQKHF